ALLATMTLLPALLAISGTRLDWPRKRARAVSHADPSEDRLVQMVLRRPVLSAGAALALLIVLALPAMSMERGSAGIESMPAGDLRDGYQMLARNFSAGMTEPVQIVIEGANDDPTNASIDTMLERLSSDPAFGAVTNRTWTTTGTIALIE